MYPGLAVPQRMVMFQMPAPVMFGDYDAKKHNAPAYHRKNTELFMQYKQGQYDSQQRLQIT